MVVPVGVAPIPQEFPLVFPRQPFFIGRVTPVLQRRSLQIGCPSSVLGRDMCHDRGPDVPDRGVIGLVLALSEQQ